MAKRYDIITGRKYTDRDGNEKTAWKNIGAAFEKDNGSIGLELDALPVSGRALLVEPKPKGERLERQQQSDVEPREPDLDDEVPF